MALSYVGHGTLYRNEQRIDEVEYAFANDATLGVKGELWSIDQYLPQRTTFRLMLNDPPNFVEICVGPGILDMSRMQFRYLIYPAPNQQDHPHNLVQKSFSQTSLSKAESE